MNFAPILFVTGLSVSAIYAIFDDWSGALLVDRSAISEAKPHRTYSAALTRQLTPVERQASVTAWTYFQSNTRESTGFVDSVAGFPSSTLWDQGSYVFALVSARNMGLISEDKFSERASKFLKSIGSLSLVDGRLPNKVYNTVSLEPTDYSNETVFGGIGWSALDIGRLLVALRVLEKHAPYLSDAVQASVSSWDLSALANNGELTGALREDGELTYVQEGRIGYEQYAARAVGLWGVDASQAVSPHRITSLHRILGVDVPIDVRSSAKFGAINPTLSEPYLLIGFELGLSDVDVKLARMVLNAQERRYTKTGVPTAVSEDHINKPPHFVYSSVFSNGENWAVVDEHGNHHPQHRTLSTKASFGWHAIFESSYTKTIRETAYSATRSDSGWHAGIFEDTGEVNDILTLNTNAIILEALHFTMNGSFM